MHAAPPVEHEHDRWLDQARALLGSADEDDALLADANRAVNQALALCPDSIDAWLLKCQVASATGDDLAALAAVEMAVQRAPNDPEALYWHGAVLGDLGRARDALHAIASALRVLGDDEHWLLEDLFYEQAMLLDGIGRHDEAVAVCALGLTRCPGSALLRTVQAPAERARVKSSLRVLRGGAG